MQTITRRKAIREMDASELQDHYNEIYRRRYGNLSSLKPHEYEEMKEIARNYFQLTGEAIPQLFIESY